MKGLVKQFKKLCPPAMLYLVLSIISFLGILMQNCQDPRKYKVGFYKVNIPCHNALFFIAKALYILVWTYILQFLCSKGYKTVSWFLVLLPIIAMFLIIGLAIIFFMAVGKKKREGFKEGTDVEEDEEDEARSAVESFRDHIEGLEEEEEDDVEEGEEDGEDM
tara:strand:- start:9954 stop:10442 length:489 start_codon:yes stop_codon:yes gene_type:complete